MEPHLNFDDLVDKVDYITQRLEANTKAEQIRYTYLTIEEACATLKVSRKTIYNLRKTGKLKSCGVGRNVRIRLSDIESFINSRMV